MAGLLDILNRSPGLLSPLPGQSALGPGIGQAQALLSQPAPVAVAPAVAPRARVNPLRVAFSTLFDGTNPFTAADEERKRLQGEAMAPQLRAQQAQTLASITDPTERALFLQAPQVWAENAGYRLRPRTLAPGSVERVNGQTVGGAPIVEKFDDRFGAIDPLNVDAGATYTAPRGLTADEQTAQAKLAWDQEYGNRNLDISQQNANTAATNAATTAANAGFTIAPGQERRGPDGAVIAANERQTPGQEAAALARQQAAAKSSAAQTAQLDTLANTRAGVNRAREQIGLLSTGRIAGVLPFNQSRTDLEAALDTIKANLSFAELAKMRANSPTGGALGSIAVRELDLLGSTLASLDPNQSQEQLKKSLDIIDASLKRYEDAIKAAPAAGATNQPTAAEARAILRSRGVPGY